MLDYLNLNNSQINPWVIFALAVWTVIWKGQALWLAGRKSDKIWFIVLLLVNTVGILDIIYLYFIGKRASLSNNPEVK